MDLADHKPTMLFNTKAEVLILTATTKELTAVRRAFGHSEGEQPKQFGGENLYFDLERINGARLPWWTRWAPARTFVTLCEPGNFVPEGARRTEVNTTWLQRFR